MPNPTPGDAHVNAPLTNISIAFSQEEKYFVADKVFPVVPVAKQSDLYYEYDRNDFYRDEAKPRAPSTESAGGGFRLSTTSYSCTVEAWHKDIDDQLRSNADSVLSLDADATRYTTLKLMIRRERRWANAFFKTGVWTTDSTPGTLWSAANSNPKADVDAGKASIMGKTGYMPNTLVMGMNVFLALRSNSDVKDQFKYVSADSIDEAMLARYFGVQRLFVCGGVYASNIEGASAAYTFIQGKHALLAYCAPAPSLFWPSAGYTFAWSGFIGSGNGTRIKRFRMEELESDRVEGQMAYDMKKVAADLGYFFASCVS